VRLRSVTLFWLLVTAGSVQAAQDPLTMGVFPRRNSAETAKLFAPMAAYLGERLGRKVTLVTSKNFEAFWEAVSEKRYDIVHYNQYHYIRSAQSYQVIAHIEEFGKSTICGAIYVRKDSGITDLAQLRGRTVMFGGGEDAMISYIANRYLLERAGLRNAILALDHRQSDAAGAGDNVLELPEVKAAMNTDELAVLAVSAPLLQLPVAVRRDMPAALRESIQSLLVNIGNDEAGREALKAASMTGMGKAEDRDYDPHRKLAAAVLGAESFAGRAVRGKP
jgi:phosphonate transport system substrate-binding protein